jgi:hypothetical protein
LHKPNFAVTSLAGENHLKKSSQFKEDVRADKIIQITLLGAEMLGRGEPQLLYAITRRQPNAKVVNAVQLSVQILGNSKVLILEALWNLLRLLAPERSSFCYMVRNMVETLNSSK